MVKADVKRDYYGDLDLPATADSEEIKKQFRLLAKLYHPDRNPGHEVDVVPKFQAVQAAHEILSDPVEKAKYDAGRARLAARNATTSSTPQNSDSYNFARSNNPKPTPATAQFPFPPPPKQKEKRPPFPPQNQKYPSSSGADKFNAFTRGAPQTWDRAKFDEARAEAARGFFTMRPPPMPPQMPPRARGSAPTAPKASLSSEMPHVPNVPPTSFPGLSRTASARKQTYTSAPRGADEAQASRSAYSYVRGDRGPAPSPNIYVQEGQNMRTPPVSRARPAVSPLRPTRSSDYDMRTDLGARPSAKYAGAGGERTDIHGDGLHRSASVRNSPVGEYSDDRGVFGKTSARQEHLPRHRSASPGMRKGGLHAEISSESSAEDEALNPSFRPKAVPRSRPKIRKGSSFHTDTDNPGLTGQFPSTNYTRIVNDSQYQYPLPESREPTRKPFPDTVSPDVEVPGPDSPLGNGGHSGHSDRPRYAPFVSASRPWSQKSRRAHRGTSFNGFPSWAVPSSVFPQTTPPRTRRQSDTVKPGQNRFLNPLSYGPFQSSKIGANSNSSNETGYSSVPSKFSAAEWHDKVTAEDIFRPSDSQVRKSPSKMNRTGSKPTTRATATPRGKGQESSEPTNGQPTNHRDSNSSDDNQDESGAFQRGRLPADFSTKGKNAAQAQPAHVRSSPDSDSTQDSRDRYVVVEDDVMDLDEAPPTTTNGNQASASTSNGIHHASTNKDTSHRSSKRQSANGIGGGVDLRDLATHPPFAPASTGLQSLDELATQLPFESRASNTISNTNSGKSPTSSRIRTLNLPRPPKPVTAPAEDRFDRATFEQYCEHMKTYMREWNAFNAKMIAHFRSRQDRVCGTMAEQWISMVGDGPDADALLDDDRTQGSGGKAGYTAYMQWLKDDAQCRDWWEEANDSHLACLEDLGRARELARRKLQPA